MKEQRNGGRWGKLGVSARKPNGVCTYLEGLLERWGKQASREKENKLAGLDYQRSGFSDVPMDRGTMGRKRKECDV